MSAGNYGFPLLSQVKSEKGTNGYDTANYNLVVGESLDAVRWPFVRTDSTTLKKRAWCAFFFRPNIFHFKFINS